MPGNESYFDRGSMDIDDIDYAANPDSSIGGVMKKKAMEHKGMKEKGDDGFVPVSDEYGNELCVHVDDFPELAKMPRGTEVMFMVRGAVKGISEGKRMKLTCFIWDAKLCGKDSE